MQNEVFRRSEWGEAFHDDVEKVLLSEEEYQEMAKALREEICKPA